MYVCVWTKPVLACTFICTMNNNIFNIPSMISLFSSSWKNHLIQLNFLKCFHLTLSEVTNLLFINERLLLDNMVDGVKHKLVNDSVEEVEEKDFKFLHEFNFSKMFSIFSHQNSQRHV